MNKKFMLVATLVCTFAVQSCVDDKETAEVTESRQLTADALAAKTELTNTGIEILDITYKADVALINAKTAVSEAKAKAAEADAATEAKNTEIAELRKKAAEAKSEAAIAQANLELQTAVNAMATLEADKEAAKIDLNNALRQLDDAKIQYEIDLASVQVDLRKFAADSIATIAGDRATDFSAAASKYQNALSNMEEKAKDLATAKDNLIKGELGLIDAREACAKSIADTKALIASREAYIAALKNLKGYVEEGKYKELKEKKAKLTKTGELLAHNNLKLLQRKKNQKEEAEKKCLILSNQNAYDILTNDFYLYAKEEYGIVTIGDVKFDQSSEPLAQNPIYKYKQWTCEFTSEPMTFSKVDEAKGLELIDVTYTDVEEKEFIFHPYYSDYDGDPQYVAAWCTNAVKELKSQIAGLRTDIADANNTYNTSLKPATASAKAAYEAALETGSYDTQKAAYEAAIDNETDNRNTVKTIEKKIADTQLFIQYVQKVQDFFVNGNEYAAEIVAFVEAWNEAIRAEWQKVFDIDVEIELLSKEIAANDAERDAVDLILVPTLQTDEISVDLIYNSIDETENGYYDDPEKPETYHEGLVDYREKLAHLEAAFDKNNVEVAQEVKVENLRNEVDKAQAAFDYATKKCEQAKATYEAILAE